MSVAGRSRLRKAEAAVAAAVAAQRLIKQHKQRTAQICLGATLAGPVVATGTGGSRLRNGPMVTGKVTGTGGIDGHQCCSGRSNMTWR